LVYIGVSFFSVKKESLANSISVNHASVVATSLDILVYLKCV
jgi:hypothetical protein